MIADTITRQELLRAAGVGGIAVGFPGLLGACGSTPRRSVDHLTLSPAGLSLQTLDVAKADWGHLVQQLATEPIVIHDDGLNVVGHLAQSWRIVDATTYVYEIRRGVRFWDGTPLTADDVAYAIRRHIDPEVGSLLAGIIPPIASIDVTRPHQVTVRLKKPDATWAHVPARILVGSKAYYERYGKDFGAPNGKVMGTGPYIVKRFRADESIDYVRNERYWGRKPLAATLKIAMIAEAQSVLLAARSGDVDGAFEASADLIGQWKNIQDVDVTDVASANLTFASFDTSVEPWNDVHVRRAFAHAFDRRGAIRSLLHGNAQITNSIVPRSQWPATVSDSRLDDLYASLPAYEFDLAKAREELAQSAHPRGLTAKIWYYASERAEKMALVWASNLEKIGVTLKLERVSAPEGNAREEDHRDLGLSMHAEWTPYYPDPIDRPLTLLPSWAAKKGHYNEANYRNPVVDRLIKENMSSTDADRRAELVAQIMRIAAEDLPYVPLWTTTTAVALRHGLAYRRFSPWHETQFWIERLGRAK